MRQHRCDATPEFFAGIIGGVEEDVLCVFDAHHLEVGAEARRVAFAQRILSFRSARYARPVAVLGQLDCAANLLSTETEYTVDTAVVIASDEFQFHDYGVPETPMICSALKAPFFSS